MATAETPTATDRGWKPYRLTVEQFLAMIAAGVFPEDDRVELLGGMLTEPMTKYPPHDFTVGRLGKLLDGMLIEPWFAREEKALVLGRSWRPEPDISVLRGPDDLYDKHAPTAVDVAFLIEVAESSYAIDRGRKWRRYAAARVATYWIVNLASRRIEVYRDPAGRGRVACYREAAIFDENAQVPVIIDGQNLGLIAVRDVLPRA